MKTMAFQTLWPERPAARPFLRKNRVAFFETTYSVGFIRLCRLSILIIREAWGR